MMTAARTWFSLVCLYQLLSLVPTVPAMVPLNEMYPFNTSQDNTTRYEDDGGSDAIHLTKPFIFNGVQHNVIFISNNGIIMFKNHNGQYRPMSFPHNHSTIIAPFWSDIDIQHEGGHVFYSQRTDPDNLDRASCDIQHMFRTKTCFKADWIFIVTWYKVGFFGAQNEGKSRSNTFQVILVSGGDASFLLFYYHQIQWTNVENSNGDANGDQAQNNCCSGKKFCLNMDPSKYCNLAGYNQVNGSFYYVIPGSTSEEIINITETSNVGSPGRWVFQVNGENVTAAESPERSIREESSSMLGGELISVSGSRFTKSRAISAHYVELNVTFPCRVISSSLVHCVTPTVYYTGQATLLVATVNKTADAGINGSRSRCSCENWSLHTPFTIKPLSHVEAKLQRNTTEWTDGANVTVSWSTQNFPSTKCLLYLLAFKSGPGRPQWITVDSHLVMSISGRFTFLLNVSSSPFATFILRLSSHNPPDLSRSLWSSIFTIYRTPSWSRDWCQRWLLSDQKLPPLSCGPCPAMLGQALADDDEFVEDNICHGDFQCHRDTARVNCVHKPEPSADDNDQICCYDQNDELADAKDLRGWGTCQRYHRSGHSPRNIADLSNFEHDVAPFVHCGILANDSRHSVGLLDEFLHQRPRGSSRGYVPLKPAQGSGDPHLTSFDGFKFTFNGLGEFVLVETIDRTAVIQVRAEQARGDNGTLQTASVFTCVAVGGVGRDTVTVALDSNMLSRIYHNGLDVPPTLNTTLHFNGISADLTVANGKLYKVKVKLDGSGLSVVVEATEDLLNVIVICRASLKGKVRGLLGNYNGRADDDLKPRDLETLPSTASNRDIHYLFGMMWNVSESETLFHYAGDAGPPSYLQADFTPTFIDDLSKTATHEMRTACGNNTECLFDYATTGSERIAMSTMKFLAKFDIMTRAVEPVTLCNFPSSYPNMSVRYSSRRVGATATYSCDMNVSQPPIAVKCNESGQWTSKFVIACHQKLQQPETTVQERTTTVVHTSHDVIQVTESPVTSRSMPWAAVGGGIGAGIVVIVVVVVTIVVVRSRRRARNKHTARIHAPVVESTEMTEYFSSNEDIPAVESINIPELFHLYRNPAFMEILTHLTEDGTFKLPRPYLDDPQLYTEFF